MVGHAIGGVGYSVGHEGPARCVGRAGRVGRVGNCTVTALVSRPFEDVLVNMLDAFDNQNSNPPKSAKMAKIDSLWPPQKPP
jgi:hypothetical protein